MEAINQWLEAEGHLAVKISTIRSDYKAIIRETTKDIAIGAKQLRSAHIMNLKRMVRSLWEHHDAETAPQKKANIIMNLMKVEEALAKLDGAAAYAEAEGQQESEMGIRRIVIGLDLKDL